MTPSVSDTHTQSRGFSLIELMIALLIVGVLLVVSLPSYQQHMIQTRRALARAELQKVAVRQEQFFLDHRRYAQSLRELGYPDDPSALDDQGNTVASAQGGIYLIVLIPEENGYRVSAVSGEGYPDDTVCGQLSLDALGMHRFSGNGTAQQCW